MASFLIPAVGNLLGGLVGKIFGHHGGNIQQMDMARKTLANMDPGENDVYVLNAMNVTVPLGMLPRSVQINSPFIAANDTQKYAYLSSTTQFTPNAILQFDLTSEGDALLNLDTLKVVFTVKTFMEPANMLTTSASYKGVVENGEIMSAAFFRFRPYSHSITGDCNPWTAAINQFELKVGGSLLDQVSSGYVGSNFLRETYMSPFFSKNVKACTDLWKRCGCAFAPMGPYPEALMHKSDSPLKQDAWPGSWSGAATSATSNTFEVEMPFPHSFFRKRRFLPKSVVLRAFLTINSNPTFTYIAHAKEVVYNLQDHNIVGAPGAQAITIPPRFTHGDERAWDPSFTEESRLMVGAITDIHLRVERQRVQDATLQSIYADSQSGIEPFTEDLPTTFQDPQQREYSHVEFKNVASNNSEEVIKIVTRNKSPDFLMLDAFWDCNNLDIMNAYGIGHEFPGEDIGAVQSLDLSLFSLKPIQLRGFASTVVVEAISVNGTEYYRRNDLPPHGAATYTRTLHLQEDALESYFQYYTGGDNQIALDIFQNKVDAWLKGFIESRVQQDTTFVPTQQGSGATTYSVQAQFVSSEYIPSRAFEELTVSINTVSRCLQYIKLEKAGSIRSIGMPRTGNIEIKFRLELPFTNPTVSDGFKNSMIPSYGNNPFKFQVLKTGAVDLWAPCGIRGLGVKPLVANPVGTDKIASVNKNRFNIKVMGVRNEQIKYNTIQVKSKTFLQSLLGWQDGER